MGKSKPPSRGDQDEITKDVLLDGLPEKAVMHPVEAANWISFATFYWMGSLMSLAYRHGLNDTDVPEIPVKEACRRNTDLLEQYWAREISLADTGSRSRPSFSRVAWKYCKGRVWITIFFYIVSLAFGFLTPTLVMKKIIALSNSPTLTVQHAIFWVSLLVLCELARVFFLTLTWAMSYRTALRLKAASMGLVYRKLLRIGNLTDEVSSKLMNVISGDCTRLYDCITSGQVAIGGPVVLIMSAVYIWYELGWLPLLGLIIFVFAYPLQYYLAKGSGLMKRKAVHVKDERVALISQVLQHFKFLKMFGWEKYLYEKISQIRERERSYIVKSQLFQSFSVVLGPTLPHIATIVTFLLYISTGQDLLPGQAFSILTIFTSRLRPTFMRVRSGFRAWFDAKIAIPRIQAFTIVFIFSCLFFSVRMLNTLYDALYSFRICSERMKSLLTLPESRDSNDNICVSNHAALDEAIVIEELTLIRRGTVGGSHDENGKRKDTKNINSIERLLGSSGSDMDNLSFQLGPIDLNVKKGSFVGICGYVGSGKTTLLETIAGALTTEKGKVNVFGRTAYAGQHPWIFKATVRDNIIFSFDGTTFDSVRYYSCVDSCCLISDFATLPLGDLTQLPNNGSNLSGGQRQRVSLARALYHQSADIYLLDDPLSGLDNRVARAVFDNAIMGKLRKLNKTILFVTHQLNYLQDCDEILVMSEGKIVQRGTHEELIADQESIYSVLSSNSTTLADAQEEILMEDSEILDLQMDTSAVSNAKKNQFELEQSRKDVSSTVYKLYIKKAGGWLAVFIVMIAFTLSAGSTSFSSWWLKKWFRTEHPVTSPPPIFTDSTQNESTGNETSLSAAAAPKEFINIDSPNFSLYRDVYASAIVAIFITSLCRSIFFVVVTVKASRGLHMSILRQFFRTRMKTLEKLGTGQIYNLFGRDIDEADAGLPNILESFLQNIFVVLSIICLVALILPAFLFFVIVILVVFCFYRRIYNTAVRDLKRIETRRRSPIFNRISETVKGLGTIRAFNRERMMTEEFEKLADASTTVTYTFSASMRWLAIRLDALAVLITGSVAGLIFVFHGSISSAAAGLALSYAAQLSGIFQFTVRLATETEAKFVSVERMNTFLSYNQVEEIEISKTSRSNNSSTRSSELTLKVDSSSVHPNWPTVGHVKFDAVTLSYSSSDSPVLRNVSFEVQAGQNIGIIGRTGSGKSSIGNALFRLVELKPGNGSIHIDGVDISTIPLDKLRNVMCVIPQDPSVFHESVRFNLDAGKQYQDYELWSVLEKTGLKSSIDNLDSIVGLSHGQKQLLCIARALLRQSKIVFVDEATSNMDIETAAIVERLIAEEFKYSTVFIVAHRMSALASCDAILIMGEGEVRDYGPKDVLSKKPEFKHSFDKFERVALE